MEPAREDVLERLCARWSLTLGPPFPPTPGSPGNFVAPATRADGSPAVLKVSPHVAETRAEIAALHFWDGAGAARLLDSDADLGALLMELVAPGDMLADEPDDAAVLVAAGVLRVLWRPAPPASGLHTLTSWTAVFDHQRESLSSGRRDFPAALFRRADTLRHELLESTREPSVLHGDLHHFNVLRSARDGWLAIDPKGLLGDRAFDVCQFLRNPRPVGAPANRRRLDLFSTALDLDRARLAQWAFVHAMLDACWDYEDGAPWTASVARAEEALTY